MRKELEAEILGNDKEIQKHIEGGLAREKKKYYQAGTVVPKDIGSITSLHFGPKNNGTPQQTITSGNDESLEMFLTPSKKVIGVDPWITQ